MKIAAITIAIVVGFSIMVMPVLVRPPQTIEQPPGSDPRGPTDSITADLRQPAQMTTRRARPPALTRCLSLRATASAHPDSRHQRAPELSRTVAGAPPLGANLPFSALGLGRVPKTVRREAASIVLYLAKPSNTVLRMSYRIFLSFKWEDTRPTRVQSRRPSISDRLAEFYTSLVSDPEWSQLLLDWVVTSKSVPFGCCKRTSLLPSVVNISSTNISTSWEERRVNGIAFATVFR